MKDQLGSHDKVVQYWNAAAPHLQARFCHRSLGTKIKIDRVGIFQYYNEKITASRNSLDRIKGHAKTVRGSADLVVYIASENGAGGVIGIAWTSVACSGKGWDGLKTSINEWRPNSVAFAGVSLFTTEKDQPKWR